MSKQDISSMTIEEITKYFESIGEKKFRAKQCYEWFHNKLVSGYDEMTNLSKETREKLSSNTFLSEIEIFKKFVSDKDNTTKYLFQMENNNIIESALMKYGYGNTVCISSQLGCKMGCRFCASTLDGLVRNLTVYEMLAQVYKIQKDIGERVSHIVIMGSGEPLDNYDNIIKFIKIINSSDGLGISQRHITLSTCGITEKIYSMADESLQITLAVSLHAPNDEIRNEIMPISKKYPMDELILACKHYSEKTKRRITFEYALINGINDSNKCAQQLAHKLRGFINHVNLIPLNEIKERNFKPSDNERVTMFAEVIKGLGVEVTVRRKLGDDINAACGQLRKKHNMLKRG